MTFQPTEAQDRAERAIRAAFRKHHLFGRAAFREFAVYLSKLVTPYFHQAYRDGYERGERDAFRTAQKWHLDQAERAPEQREYARILVAKAKAEGDAAQARALVACADHAAAGADLHRVFAERIAGLHTRPHSYKPDLNYPRKGRR